MPSSHTPLSEALAGRREAIAARWLERALPTPHGASPPKAPDPFRNPVAHTFLESLRGTLNGLLEGDGLLEGSAGAALLKAIEPVVRWRAVQAVPPAEALAFLFELKSIVRREAPSSASPLLDALDARIDSLALLAFGLYVECREKQFEIRANEARRRTYMLERAHPPRDLDEIAAPAASAMGPPAAPGAGGNEAACSPRNGAPPQE